MQLGCFLGVVKTPLADSKNNNLQGASTFSVDSRTSLYGATMHKIIHRLAALAAVLFLGFCLPAAAEVYRCETAHGVSYSDQQCGSTAERVDSIDANGIDEKYGFQRYLHNRKQHQVITPAPAVPYPPTPAAAPPVNVNVQPQVNCPSQTGIKQAIRRRHITLCMTPAQVRSATPVRVSGFTQLTNFDQFGTFTEWRYSAVPNRQFPVRIQFRDGRVFGFETLPLRFRD